VTTTTRILAAAGLLALTWSAPALANEPSDLAVELLAQLSTWVVTHANGIVSTAYERAPVLMIVLAAMLILPVTALAMLLVQSMKLRARKQAGNRTTDTQPVAMPRAQPSARLIGADGRYIRLPSSKDVIRLGRHENNDIRLGHASIHRHHAVIHANAAAYAITDVSGISGNGLHVNGQRIHATDLAAGDVITIGDLSLTFEFQSQPTRVPSHLSQI
jgi:hypothetical protein